MLVWMLAINSPGIAFDVRLLIRRTALHIELRRAVGEQQAVRLLLGIRQLRIAEARDR